MPSTPPLSYKKPLSVATAPSSSQGASASSLPSETASLAPSTTPTASTRKFLSRRKALQDYYNIDHDSSRDDTAPVPPHGAGNTDWKLKDQDMPHFLQSSSMVDILKTRNEVSGTQTSQDLEKKEIIYDNYYELIKLNETLNNLSNPSSKKDATVLIPNRSLSDNYVEDTLNDLSSFVGNVVSKFSTDFDTVLRNLDVDQADDSASITAITGAEAIPQTVDKQQLVREISFLLGKSVLKTNGTGKADETQLLEANTEKETNTELQEDYKAKLKGDIDTIVASLDPTKQELLIRELKDVKTAL